MPDQPLNPQGWNPNPSAIPPYTPPTPPPSPPYEDEDEAYDDDVEPEVMTDDSLEHAPEEGESIESDEEDSTEAAASGPSLAARFKTLAASGGATCLRLAGGAASQLAKLPAALRKKQADPLDADPESEGASLSDMVGDPSTMEESEGDPDPDAEGFLKTRSSRIQMAAFVSTGLLTTALVVHNVLKPATPDATTATKPASKKPTIAAKAEPAPEPELTVVSGSVAPPPTAIAAAPPEAIAAEPAPIAAAPPEPVAETAPPEPVAAVATDPFGPEPTPEGVEPPPVMPALPPTEEVAAAPVDAGPDLPPPALAPEIPAPIAAPEADPTAIASAPTDITSPEPLAATPPAEPADNPPALAVTPSSESTPAAPELPPTLPDPTAMAAAPALAIPTLAPPPSTTPEPAPAPEPPPVVAAAPEPAPIAVPTPSEPPPEPPAEPVPVAAAPPPPAAFDAADLKPLPNAGRRVLTMGTPIGGPLPVDAVAVAAASAAPLAAAAVPISAESFQVEHVVQSGENFWTISKLYYGSGRFYKALWKANARTVKAPDALVVGNTIVVPPPESLDRTLIDPPGGNVASAGRSTVRDPSARRTVQGADGSMSLPVGRSTALAESVAALEPEAPRPSHVVRDGETLRSIARDRLGNSRRESEIRQLNLDVISDDQPVVGQRLRLPNDATATQRR